MKPHSLLEQARDIHGDPTLHTVYDYEMEAWTVCGRIYVTTSFPTERAALACAVVDADQIGCPCVVCDWYYNKYIDGDET